MMGDYTTVWYDYFESIVENPNFGITLKQHKAKVYFDKPCEVW